MVWVEAYFSITTMICIIKVELKSGFDLDYCSPIGATVKWRQNCSPIWNLVESFVKEYSTPSNPLLPGFGHEVVLSHHRNHIPCIVVGQGRVVLVVMVVSNAPYPSLSLKN